jgi:hypothetical protein
MNLMLKAKRSKILRILALVLSFLVAYSIVHSGLLAKTTLKSKALSDKGNNIFLAKYNPIDSLKQKSELYPVSNGYINNVGKLVLKLAPNTYVPRQFSEGLAAVRVPSPSSKSDVHLGYIDQVGEFVIPPRFIDSEGLEGAENFSEGLAAATLPTTEDDQGSSLYGYINNVGKMIIAPKFYGASAFSDGIAVVELRSEGLTKFAFINKQGDIIFQHPQAYEAFNSSEGLAAVRINELWGFIDATGKFVIKPQFPQVGRFSNGLAPAIQSGSCGSGQYRDQYGYIDRTGKFVIKPQFNDAMPFAEGLAAVKIGEDLQSVGQWGYIDTSGKFVIKPQFEDTLGAVSDFSEGLAAVTVPDSRFGYNGKTGYIDRTGRFVIPPQFNSGAAQFDRGLAYVSVMFEKEIKGQPIPNPPPKELSEQQRLDIFHSTEFYSGGGKFGYINQQGKFVWEEKYGR